jgi:hypothetical protein
VAQLRSPPASEYWPCFPFISFLSLFYGLEISVRKNGYANHGLAGWAISVASFDISTSQGKMADTMGFLVD